MRGGCITRARGTLERRWGSVLWGVQSTIISSSSIQKRGRSRLSYEFLCRLRRSDQARMVDRYSHFCYDVEKFVHNTGSLNSDGFRYLVITDALN